LNIGAYANDKIFYTSFYEHEISNIHSRGAMLSQRYHNNCN
jgi:hypothetical protein